MHIDRVVSGFRDIHGLVHVSAFKARWVYVRGLRRRQYHQMDRWSFNLQIYFLNSRFRQVLQIRESGKKIIQDRTIYEDAHIFAPNLHAMGLMANRDYNNYTSLFELMEGLVGAPDLLIYLRSSIPNLVSQIHKRGRDYENSIYCWSVSQQI